MQGIITEVWEHPSKVVAAPMLHIPGAWVIYRPDGHEVKAYIKDGKLYGPVIQLTPYEVKHLKYRLYELRNNTGLDEV